MRRLCRIFALLLITACRWCGNMPASNHDYTLTDALGQSAKAMSNIANEDVVDLFQGKTLCLGVAEIDQRHEGKVHGDPCMSATSGHHIYMVIATRST